jgi:putative membrane protein
MGLRIAVVVAAGGAHSFLAKLLYSRAPALPSGGGQRTAEIELASQWMYYGGHLADLMLLTALLAIWYRHAERLTRRSYAPARTGRWSTGVRASRTVPAGPAR